MLPSRVAQASSLMLQKWNQKSAELKHALEEEAHEPVAMGRHAKMPKGKGFAAGGFVAFQPVRASPRVGVERSE